MYEELGGENFEIITVAQDTLGEEATAEWHEKSPLTYTTLIDTAHRVSSLYNLVNVPSGVWVDEEGNILRIDEGTYSEPIPFGNNVFVGTDDYRPAVRDWVMNGPKSRYVLTSNEVAAQIRRRTPDEALAEPTFKLGVYFFRQGNEDLGRSYWEAAQALFPDSWNFHRQDWNLTEGLGGPKYREKRGDLGEKPYYKPFDFPEEP